MTKRKRGRPSQSKRKRSKMAENDDDIPDLVNLSETSTSEEENTDDEFSDEDDSFLHGVCGEPPVGADIDSRVCLIGKYMVKEFLPEVGDEKQLYTGEITAYDQLSHKFTVVYHSDGVQQQFSRAETQKMHNEFESWYAKVSRKGQRFTRRQALPVVVGAYNKERMLRRAKVANPTDLTHDSDEETPDAAKVRRDVERGVTISKMKVVKLREELRELHLNFSGPKCELQTRLCKHYNCTLPAKSQQVKGKHAAKWTPTQIPVTRTAFEDTKFNEESLQQNLPGFKDGVMPEPWQCHSFFFTSEMWEQGTAQANLYPKTLAAQTARPPWTPKNCKWPPAWTSRAKVYDVKTYQHMTMLLHALGLKHCSGNVVRKMFGNDPLYKEQWLKQQCTRLDFEAFLRQLHFEDAVDPHGKRYSHSINFRPNGVPKVGLFAERYRCRCVLFRPERDMSFDEATAKYGGRMTHLKHLQSKYKPYDGIRIYSLNGSKSGYTQNFRVDLRDGTTTATMLRGCVEPFYNKGYNIWGDNAFVSVEMLKHLREHNTNFAGTSRTTFGFPKTLTAQEDLLDMGEWKWLMADPGLLAAYWCDVGYVKLMSNFHTPAQGQVLRRVKGQADRQERGAPMVGEEYNDKMGGTDKKDFMRGLYTVFRRSKKWWKSLYYWVLDAAMYNAFVLHRWCFNFFNPRKKYKLRYSEFIRAVIDHFLLDEEKPCFTPRPRCAVRRTHRGVPMLPLEDGSPNNDTTPKEGMFT